MAKEYVFKVTMQEFDKRTLWRRIAIRDDASLYVLAQAIIFAFEFEFDHCFGFFEKTMKGFGLSDVGRKYELFTDLIAEGQDLEPTGAESVKKTKVGKVWKVEKDQMLFLFDYGDDWWFLVRLEKIGVLDAGRKYPLVIEKKGDAPVQYASSEDGESDGEEPLLFEDDTESEFFESTTEVRTGLGGAGSSLRYCFVMAKEERIAFSKQEQVYVKMAIDRMSSLLETMIEGVTFDPTGYAVVAVLVPIDIPVAEYIENVLDICKTKGIELKPAYLVTNASLPSEKEIMTFLYDGTPKGFHRG